MTPEDEQLLSRVPPETWARNGIPEPDVAAARERGAVLAAGTLADHLRADGIRASPMGAAWSTDLDLHLASSPSSTELRSRGWIPLDDLLSRLGSPGTGRWAVVDGGAVLACADFHDGVPPDPVASLLGRCLRRGEVRVREVLELRALLRSGATLPQAHPVIDVAARVERGLGGDLLAHWAMGPTLAGPARVGGRRARTLLAPLREAFRPRQVIALSGVDGAGKSTVAGLLARDLGRLGIQSTIVWTRPGMRLKSLDRLARWVKHLFRQEAAPGIGKVAAGKGEDLASRRGVVGWAWALLVTLSFLWDMRKRHRRARGVVIFDRHLLDALVTLDFAYRGVDLRLHRSLVRRLLPKADFTAYLQVPAELAVARKQDDLFGELAVRDQLDVYSARLPQIKGIRVLDGTGAPGQLALEVLELIGRVTGYGLP